MWIAKPPKFTRCSHDLVPLRDALERTASAAPRSPGLWVRRVGRGWVVWAGVELFGAYLRMPTPQMRQLFAHLITKLRRPAVTLDGPLCVTVNTRRRADGTVLIHLHNNPGTAYAYPTPPLANYLHTPGEVLEARDLAIRLHGMAAQSARSGLSGRGLTLSNGGRSIIVSHLPLHEVVLVKTAQRGV